MPSPIRVTAAPGLLSRSFVEDSVRLREGHWTEVNADDPKVRRVLLARAPKHVRVAQDQAAALTAAGLALDGLRLIDARAEKKKESAKPTR